MTQQGRIYGAMLKGDRTSVDVSARLDLPVAKVAAQLRVLMKAGRLRRLGQLRTRTGRRPYVYAVIREAI